MQDLGVIPGGNSSSAEGISASGEIVGTVGAQNGQYSAFVWTQQAGMEPISVGSSSLAFSVNSAGQVVGFEDEGRVAFLWTPTRRYQNLNNLIPPNSGWLRQIARSINQSGQIAVMGTFNDGQTRVALLTPTN